MLVCYEKCGQCNQQNIYIAVVKRGHTGRGGWLQTAYRKATAQIRDWVNITSEFAQLDQALVVGMKRHL